MMELSAAEQAALVRDGRVTARELVEECLAAIERTDPEINAFVLTCPERALAEADAVAPGDERPLAGVPIAIKDLIVLTEGLRTTNGSNALPDFVPDTDSAPIRALREAGAIVVGKTNTPEFEVGINTRNPVFGQTVHPLDEALGCGGSSGGAAVALATGMCAIADGTDHGGSIRIPASLVGVAGLRPSPGRVPLYPTAWVNDTLSVPGPLARTVRDLALMLSVMAGPDPRIPISLAKSGEGFANTRTQMRGRRVAWSTDLGGLCAVEPEVASAVRRAAEQFAALGCVVE